MKEFDKGRVVMKLILTRRAAIAVVCSVYCFLYCTALICVALSPFAVAQRPSDMPGFVTESETTEDTTPEETITEETTASPIETSAVTTPPSTKPATKPSTELPGDETGEGPGGGNPGGLPGGSDVEAGPERAPSENVPLMKDPMFYAMIAMIAASAIGGGFLMRQLLVVKSKR